MRELFRRRWMPIAGALVAIAVVIVVLVLTGVISGNEGGRGGVPDYVARVNGAEIPRETLDAVAGDLTTYYRQLVSEVESFFQGANGAYTRLRIFHDALLELIRRELIHAEGARRGIAIDTEVIEERTQLRYATLLGQYGIAEQQHAEYLEATGSSLEEYLANLREEVTLQLETETVQERVVQSTETSPADLLAHYEAKRDRFADESGNVPPLDEIEEAVRADLLTETRGEIIAAWYEEILDAAKIEITIPLLDAYHVQTEDPEAGIEAFDRLRREGTLADIHLTYYMGRAVEGQAMIVEGTRYELEELADRTPAQDAEIADLLERQNELEAQALSLYVESLQQIEPDESFIARVMRLEPDERTVLLLDALIFQLRGDIERATSLLEDLVASEPDFLAAHLAAGDLAAEQGEIDRARELYEAALAIEPENTTLHIRLANLEMAAGDLAAARSRLEQVRAVDEASPWLRIAEGDLASIELESALSPADVKRLADEAVAAYRDVLERSGDLGINVKLARALYLGGDFPEAKVEFEYVIRYSPYTMTAYEGHGDVLSAQGDDEGAVSDYRLALAMAIANTARIRLLEKIVALSPESTDDRLDLAELYEAQERWDDAVSTYLDVLEIDGSLTDVYLLIGDARRRSGDLSAAVDALEEGLEAASFVSQRVRFLEALVGVYREIAGDGGTLGQAGLDTLLDLAPLQLDMGRTEAALDAVRSVASEDPSYRAEEVRALFERIEAEDPSLLTEEERTP